LHEAYLVYVYGELTLKVPFKGRYFGLSTCSYPNLISSECNVCAGDYMNQRLHRYHLSCGHVYCPHALRELKRNAVERGWGKPYCCGRPIPAPLIDAVLVADEESASVRGMRDWDDVASTTSSLSARVGASQSPDSEIRPRTIKRRYTTLCEQSTILAAHEARMNLAKALEIPDFRALHIKHRMQRDRFLLWNQVRRKELQTHYATQMEAMMREHERLQEQLSEQVGRSYRP